MSTTPKTPHKPTAHRVACGAAFLDRVRPGWAEKIDLDVLTMSSTCYCVLGQLYGGIKEAMDELKAKRGWLVNHGFDVAFLAEEYARLDALWAREVERRVRP